MPPHEFRYACKYWGVHLSQGRVGDAKLVTSLSEFAFRCMMWWLEALALLRETEAAYTTLQKAKAWLVSTSHRLALQLPLTCPQVKTPETARLVSILDDGCYLVQTARFAIRSGHQHMYRSIIPFIPRRTVLSEVYRSQADQDVAVIRGFDDHWSRCIMTFPGNRSTQPIAYSPTGNYLSAGSADGVVRIWDASTAQLIHTLDHGELKGFTGFVKDTNAVNCVCFSSNEMSIVASSNNQKIRLWDLTDGHLVQRLEHGREGIIQSVAVVAFSSDDAHVVFAASDYVHMWDATNYQHASAFRFRDNLRMTLSMVISGDWLAVCSLAGLQVTDLRTRAVITSASSLPCVDDDEPRPLTLMEELTGRRSTNAAIERVACSPNHNLVIFGCSGANKVCLRNKGSLANDTMFEVRRVAAVAISADGTKFATASRERRERASIIQIWARDQESPILSLPSNGVKSLIFSPDGTRIATSAAPHGLVRVWDITPDHDIILPPSHTIVNWNEVTVTSPGTDVEEAQTPPVTQTTPCHTSVVRYIEFSPDGSRIVSSGDDLTIRFWDTATGELMLTLPQTSQIACLVFSPDGSVLAAGVTGGVLLLDPKTGQCKRKLLIEPDKEQSRRAVTCVAFSQDGEYLLIAPQGPDVQLWPMSRETPGLVLRAGESPVYRLALSPGLFRVAVATQDRGLKIITWTPDLATGEATCRISAKLPDLPEWIIEDMKFMDDDIFIIFTHEGMIALNAETGDRITDDLICQDPSIRVSFDPFCYWLSGPVLEIVPSSPFAVHIPLLILPPSHTPGKHIFADIHPMAAHGDYIAIGCESGQVVIIKVNLELFWPGSDVNYGRRTCKTIKG